MKIRKKVLLASLATILSSTVSAEEPYVHKVDPACETQWMHVLDDFTVLKRLYEAADIATFAPDYVSAIPVFKHFESSFEKLYDDVMIVYSNGRCFSDSRNELQWMRERNYYNVVRLQVKRFARSSEKVVNDLTEVLQRERPEEIERELGKRGYYTGRAAL